MVFDCHFSIQAKLNTEAGCATLDAVLRTRRSTASSRIRRTGFVGGDDHVARTTYLEAFDGAHTETRRRHPDGKVRKGRVHGRAVYNARASPAVREVRRFKPVWRAC